MNYFKQLTLSLCSVDQKSFDYQFLDTLDKRGQVVTNEGDKKGGRKGYQCVQNYNRVG